jgi:hypothetical protein
MFRITPVVLLIVLSGLPNSRPNSRAAEELGSVHFATSCNAAVQIDFNRAVALLHSFQFSRAIQGFNSVLKNDPTCAISYWGIALSQWGNPFSIGAKDDSQLKAGLHSVERAQAVVAKTKREEAYIAAVGNLYADFDHTPQQKRLLAYRDAMENIAKQYPDDHEARIFYALALAASEDPADKTYAARLKAGALLENLFEEEPNHPGLAHYLIHTYDVPPLASKALDAARRYSRIAPDAPHALHMPSHTFTRVGDWQDSIDSNRAAVVASRREGQTAEELHASDYLMYAYLQTAQDDAARKLVESLPEIAARFDPKIIISGAAPPSAGYFALAAIPARYALEARDWARSAHLQPQETPFPYTEAMTWFARGIGAARLRDAAKAQQAVVALDSIRARLEKAKELYWAGQVEIQRLEVNSWALFAQEDRQGGLAMMESAAQMEDRTDKSAITPGPLAPARELLAEMLLDTNQPARALEQFEATLRKEPNRFRALYGAARAAQLTGKSGLSRQYFNQLLKNCERADKADRTELLEARAALSAN